MGWKRKLGIGGLVILSLFILLIVVGVSISSMQDQQQEELQTPTMSLNEVKLAALYGLEYDTLLRHNEDYVGDIVFYRGEVVQVIHRFDETYLLVVAPESEEWSLDRLAVHYSGPRILEDDIVDIYGTVTGLHESTTVLGAQNISPEIDALYLELVD